MVWGLSEKSNVSDKISGSRPLSGCVVWGLSEKSNVSDKNLFFWQKSFMNLWKMSADVKASIKKQEIKNLVA